MKLGGDPIEFGLGRSFMKAREPEDGQARRHRAVGGTIRTLVRLTKNAVKAAFFVPLVLVGAGIGIARWSRRTDQGRKRR